MKFTNVQVNKQRNLDKYKEKKRDSIVVILFINHKPVSQPIIWEEWKKINNVEYKVVCPFTITVNCSFSRKYQLEDDFYMNENTQWGSFSYSYYLIESIKKNLEMYKDIDNGMIYIVSGDDIPLYNLHPINFNHNELVIKSSGVISNFSGFCFKKLREINFKEKTYIGFLKYYNGQKNISGFQPPEFYWYNYFHGEPEKEDRNDFLNLQFHRYNGPFSPIEWYFFIDQFENTIDHTSVIINLKKLLLLIKQYSKPKTLFFRKVMSSCETRQLLDLLQDCFWRTTFFYRKFFYCPSITFPIKFDWPFIDNNEIFVYENKIKQIKSVYLDSIQTSLKDYPILQEKTSIYMDALLQFLRSSTNNTGYKETDCIDIYFYLKSISQDSNKIQDIVNKLQTIQKMINNNIINENDIKKTDGIQTLLIERKEK